MRNHRYMPAAMLAAAIVIGLSGCGLRPRSTVAYVNVAVLQSTWPKFINYQNQLQANLNAIQSSKLSQADKQRELLQLNQQSARWQIEVTNDVKDAVKQIAADKHYSLVVTRQGIAYGGDDITSDVQAALHITPTSPSPSQ